MDENKNPWKTINSELVHETPWISVSSHEVINPSGNPGQYSTVHYKCLAIGIIPLDEANNTWIVGQYRYPILEYSWEIPEGGGDLGIDPLASAKRELLEETGIMAGNWTKILEMHLSNSATDELGMVFIARDLSFHESSPDDTEELVVRKLPFEQLFEMAVQNKVKDSLTVAGVLKARILMDRGEL